MSAPTEQAVRARERALAKARKTRQANARKRERLQQRINEQHRAWLARERDAFLAYQAAEGEQKPKLLAAWRELLLQDPTYREETA